METLSLPPKAGPDSGLMHAVSGHYLSAVVLELIVKILFELDVGERAPFTHNLPRLYESLATETKVFIEDHYDCARERKRCEFERRGVADVIFHPLADVLAHNEDLVKNFKYDAMATPANHSEDVVFYVQIFRYIEERRRALHA